MMKSVLVVRSSNRAIDEQPAASVAAVLALGASLVAQSGSADVAHARNVALTRAVNVLRAERSLAVVLMVDDDIVFQPRAAELVAAAAAHTGNPVSACYALSNGHVPFERLANGRFMGGVGFLAVPALELIGLAGRSHVYTTDDGEALFEFTCAGSEPRDDGTRRWLGEDFRLTRALGGVDMLPVSVGHLKTRVLLPDLEALARSQWFEGGAGPAHV